MFSINEE